MASFRARRRASRRMLRAWLLPVPPALLFTACFRKTRVICPHPSSHAIRSAADQSRLRLAAAKGLLKLAASPAYRRLITPSIFVAIAQMMQDSCVQVRGMFAHKLHVLLSMGRLPAQYAACFVLSAIDPVKERREEVRRLGRGTGTVGHFTSEAGTSPSWGNTPSPLVSFFSRSVPPCCTPTSPKPGVLHNVLVCLPRNGRQAALRYIYLADLSDCSRFCSRLTPHRFPCRRRRQQLPAGIHHAVRRPPSGVPPRLCAREPRHPRYVSAVP